MIKGMELSAVNILKRAVELDNASRFTESIVCYQEGLGLLIEVSKSITDKTKKQHFQQRISNYMDRAEQLKKHIEKEKREGKYHEQLQIEDNSTGHSYEKVMGRFIDSDLSVVEIDDPYIRSFHQIQNLLRFCELLIKSEAQVRRLILTTGPENSNEASQQQQSNLEQLKANLSSYNLVLDIRYNPALHDREIRFNNGWIIKIGRGLDYFKPVNKLHIGFCDMDLRPTHKTTVDIFHKSSGS